MVLQLSAAALPHLAPAQARGLDTLIPARPVGYVNDFARLLQPGETAGLESLLRRLKAATGAELVVVTLPSIGDQSEADVALAIGRRWGIGPKAEIGDPRRN
ncbi:MAG TPA: TPM domain-containing protein, partial [Gemmatimonadales bacterium]|nr:TPM domain-containing protein [Gemmatimonadales bacterium]